MVPADLSGGVELVSDVIAATIHKAAELHAKTSDGANATVPKLLTTEGRKQILADRKEAARLEMERVEREAAKKELADAIEAAKAARDAAPPAPQEGGATAMKAASALLDKPMKRAKKAVDFPEADMAAADGLKQELDDAKKEREVAERLERERIEREAAQEELKEAIASCETSRDPAAVVKALKRCKKAVDADADLITKGEGLKAACDEEKAAAAKAAKEEAAAAKQAEKERLRQRRRRQKPRRLRRRPRRRRPRRRRLKRPRRPRRQRRLRRRRRQSRSRRQPHRQLPNDLG